MDQNDKYNFFIQSGISSNAKIGEIVAKVTAFDPDQEDNGTLIYSLEKTTLFSLGTRTSARILEKPPFVINKDGAVLTDGAMNIYLHDHFRCIIQCQERNPPSRSATSTLDVSSMPFSKIHCCF